MKTSITLISTFRILGLLIPIFVSFIAIPNVIVKVILDLFLLCFIVAEVDVYINIRTLKMDFLDNKLKISYFELLPTPKWEKFKISYDSIIKVGAVLLHDTGYYMSIILHSKDLGKEGNADPKYEDYDVLQMIKKYPEEQIKRVSFHIGYHSKKLKEFLLDLNEKSKADIKIIIGREITLPEFISRK